MITIERISGIEGIAYVYDLAKYASREQSAGISLKAMSENILNTTVSGVEEIARYMSGGDKPQDNGIHEKESEGRLFTLGTPAAPDMEKWEQRRRKTKEPPEQIAPFGVNGEVLTFEEAVRAGKGYHPKTGQSLIQHNTDKRTFGNDVQFGLPKSYSIMWGLGSSAAAKGSELGKLWKDVIEEGQARAVQRALRYAHENGLLIARRSEKKTGHEGAGHVMFGQYEHKTSREGDPHVHTHNIWYNICVREDGTSGTVDNAQLKKHAGAIAALYRMEANNYICEKLGVSASKVERNCELDGVPEEILTLFSKRRGQVVEGLRDFGLEDTAAHREAAKHANRNTRKDKSEQPSLVELYDRWDMEAAAKGWRFETLVEAVKEAAKKKEWKADEAWIEKLANATDEEAKALPAERPKFDMESVKARAYSALVSTNSVFEEKRILKEVFEELQVYTDADTAIQAVRDLVSSGDLVPLEKRGDDLYYTTAAIIETEKALLRNALSMKGNQSALDPEAVEEYIKAGRILADGRRANLKDEQKNAVRWLCGPDQLSVVQGRAGAGKSFMLATVADIHRALGRQVFAIAPSHKAKEVVANDAQIAQEMAKAVAGFIAGYDRQKINVDKNTTVIVDEAGMIGLDDMQKLVQIAKETGARIILSGDTKQLQPIAKGAPMALLSKGEVCGATLLAEITRQQDERQREASVKMSNGDIKGGMRTYLNTGRVSFSDSSMDEAKAAYQKDMDENPTGTRMYGVFRNSHATKLNLEHREHLKAIGAIEAEGYTGGMWTRGLNQRVVERELCAGDRIIFGESFKLNDLEISNNTTATINRIAFGTDAEPVLTVTTDDGRTFTAKPSEMVGYRDENAKDRTTPKIDHAYAQTVYSLQGSTVDRMFVYAGEAGNAELAYVMMTRHKLDCRVFVDKQRIHDELAASSGKTMFLNKKSGGAEENHTDAAEAITDEQIIEKWLAENQKSSAKLNVCDFHPTPQEFLGEKIAKEPVEEAEKNMEQETKNPEQDDQKRVVQPFPMASVRPLPRVNSVVGQKPEDIRAGGNGDVVRSVGEQVQERSASLNDNRLLEAKKKRGWVEITKDDVDYIVLE